MYRWFFHVNLEVEARRCYLVIDVGEVVRMCTQGPLAWGCVLSPFCHTLLGNVNVLQKQRNSGGPPTDVLAFQVI